MPMFSPCLHHLARNKEKGGANSKYVQGSVFNSRQRDIKIRRHSDLLLLFFFVFRVL